MRLVGGWDKLTKMVKLERRTLRTEVHQRVVTLESTRADTEHDVFVELEAKRLGNLGVKEVTKLLTADCSSTRLVRRSQLLRQGSGDLVVLPADRSG